MKNVFIFDVDGTLTPSRDAIDPFFFGWFLDWTRRGKKEVYLATGSDYIKSQEQLGNAILNSVSAVFSCAGNAIYSKGQLKYENNWKLTSEQYQWLNEQLFFSSFPLKTGRHIENRIGLVNFSVVGRNADKDQRQKYVEFDKRTGERRKIAASFNLKFGSTAVAQVAGETGIDIVQPGHDKGQIAKYFNEPDVHVYFFGDQIVPGGNDYPLAEELRKQFNSGHSKFTKVKVNGWRDTWNFLKTMENTK